MRSTIILIFFFIQFGYCQLPQIMWHHDLDDMAFGMSALEDLDGDALPEIVFSTYRNDERILVLNAEDGSLLWDYNTGGCNDVAPLIYDVDMDGELEIVLPGSCNPKTFCFDAKSGVVEWVTTTHGSDSPPTVADIDNDGKPEILHGEFGGWVLCLNGEDGSVKWNHLVDGNSWIQTAPTILDVDGDEYLDFVIANWNFGDDHKIFAYRANDHQLLWETELPDGVMYHGASHADIDNDGKEELVIGDYSGQLIVLNAEDGSIHWTFRFPFSYSVAAPTNIADLDQDGDLEIIFFDWFQLGVLDHEGNLVWKYEIPNNPSSFRGAAISDVNDDEFLDIVFATSDGKVYGVDGFFGEELWSVDLRADIGESNFDIDHAPVISDFDDDGFLDLFVVGGHAEYPEVQNNYGRAYAISIGNSGGPGWPMFRHNARRTACLCEDPVNSVETEKIKPQIELLFTENGQTAKRIGGGKESYQLKIYSPNGENLQTKQIQKKITLEMLPPGIYFFQLVDGDDMVLTGRFVVSL